MLITDVVKEITDSNFDEFIKNEGVTVVDFHAYEWCAPCKVLSPIVDQLAIDYFNEKKSVKIGKIDIDNSRDKAVELGITSVPTILIYKDGSLMDRSVGMIPKNKLDALIRKHL